MSRPSDHFCRYRAGVAMPLLPLTRIAPFPAKAMRVRRVTRSRPQGRMTGRPRGCKRSRGRDLYAALYPDGGRDGVSKVFRINALCQAHRLPAAPRPGPPSTGPPAPPATGHAPCTTSMIRTSSNIRYCMGRIPRSQRARSGPATPWIDGAARIPGSQPLQGARRGHAGTVASRLPPLQCPCARPPRSATLGAKRPLRDPRKETKPDACQSGQSTQYREA